MIRLIILVAIGAGAAVFIGPQYFSLPNGSSATTEEGSRLPFDSGGRVKVADQGAGEVVLIESLNVAAPGVWVAVREITATGDLGNVLGAARARASVEHLAVALLRATLPKSSYAVVLYRDDGDDVFNHETDSVYVDFDTGVPVVAPFSTTP